MRAGPLRGWRFLCQPARRDPPVMLTQGEDVEAHALRERGWSISAIARHLDHDRKTVRGYLSGERQPGVRRTSTVDPLAVVEHYIRLRFSDDCHVWASALYDEVVPLGYTLSYPSFVRQIRLRGLRPHCEACRGVKGRDTIEIDHPAGEEIQWDWFERRNAPWGGTAYVLLGTLPHSGASGACLPESMDQPHLIEAMDKVHASSGRDRPGVAHRPSGHRDRARNPRRPGQLRPGGQALRGRRRTLSAETGQPQGVGRVLGALLFGAVVAHADGHRPRVGPDLPRPLPGHHRRRPRAPRCERRAHHGRGAGRQPNRCWRCRGRPSRPRSVSSASWPTTPRWPSGATATRCRRG